MAYWEALMSHLDDLFVGYDEHLTVAELAELLGIKVPTAYKWLREGILPGYKVGSQWVILREEVKERVASGRNLAREDMPADPEPGDLG